LSAEKFFPKGLLFDAGPVIDFANADYKLFNLINNHIGYLYINNLTAKEVENSININCLRELGFNEI
jgi:hypothetical protein